MSKPVSIRARMGSALPRLLVLAAAVGAVPALAACGGSKSPANGAAAEQSREGQDEARLARFARCMREHGVEAKTSSGPGHQSLGIRVSGKAGAGRQTLETAQRACKQYQPQPKKVNLSPQEKVAQEEAVLKFAKCMREHGVNVHASASDGRVQLQVGGPGASAGPNPESPSFQAAQKACQRLLPLKAKRGPGGGPSTSSEGPGPGRGSGSGASFGVGG
jgi:hypothetical protein